MPRYPRRDHLNSIEAKFLKKKKQLNSLKASPEICHRARKILMVPFSLDGAKTNTENGEIYNGNKTEN